ncbi:MAG: aminodeoxychorismate synthase component I [Aeromonas sp.]|nr:aminodeoxychorismate synthase component I [Aeromonas sp.]
MLNAVTIKSFSFQALSLNPLEAARTLFAPLAQQPWAILLESASPDHPDSRFHILSAEPLATLQTRGTQTQIDHAGQAHFSDEDPLTLLAQWQHQLFGPLDEDDGDLPFVGGALGLFGYDLGRRFERLPSQAQADIELADMAVGLYDWGWVLDNQQQMAHLLVRGDEAAWQRRHAWWQAQTVRQQSALAQAPLRLLAPWQSNMDVEGYRARFTRVQEHLAAGDCYQINLTQRFSAPYAGDEWSAYCELSRHNQAPFSAFIRLPQSCVLSLSPERFLALSGRQVSTKPIKGTRPRALDPELDAAAAQELQQAPKDRAENLMIVDLLRNDIGRVCVPGSVRVPELFAIESFPAVHHLVSTIEGELLPGLEATDLLRACFPGGSITGAPKIRAMEIIEELEPHRRNAYCGSIGYISQHGRMDTSITIRTLIAEGGRLYVWAGGGLVADSRVEEEYAETFHKLGKILPILEDLERLGNTTPC